MSRLSSLSYATVVSRTDATQDITDQYGAAQRALADARALRTSLLKQLATATTTEQIDSLKAQIHDAEASISSDQATLNRLNHQVGFSQVSVQINARRTPVPVSHGSGGFGVGQAAHDAGRVLTVAAGVALIALAALTPVALVAALALVDGKRGSGGGAASRRSTRPDSEPARLRPCGMHGHDVHGGHDTIALLSRVPVFSTLSEDELAHVARVAMSRRFDAGAAVFKEGDEGSTCYIVRAGRTRAIREHPDGRSITLAHFGPGDIFGEMAMLDGERRSATVEATEDTETIAILSADMHRLLREHSDISVKLIAALGQRLRDTNERLTRQSFQTVQSRVAAALAQLVAAARRVRGRRERRRGDHHDPGGARSAGGFVPRIGQPVPGRARAGGNNYSRTGKADRS